MTGAIPAFVASPSSPQAVSTEGFNPGESDIGRNVIYHGHAGEREAGYITSFNEHFVFVRYGMGSTSQATRRDQLTFAA